MTSSVYFTVSFSEPKGEVVITYQVTMTEPPHRKWWEVVCRAVLTRRGGIAVDRTLGSRDGKEDAKKRILKHLQDNHSGLTMTVIAESPHPATAS